MSESYREKQQCYTYPCAICSTGQGEGQGEGKNVEIYWTKSHWLPDR